MSTAVEITKRLKAAGVIVPPKANAEKVRALEYLLDGFLAMKHEDLKKLATEERCVAPRNVKLPMAAELVNKGVLPVAVTPAPKAAAPKPAVATPTPKASAPKPAVTPTPTPTKAAVATTKEAEALPYLLELKIDALKALVLALKLEAKKNLKQSMIDALIATGLTAKQLAAKLAAAAAK